VYFFYEVTIILGLIRNLGTINLTCLSHHSFTDHPFKTHPS